MVNVWYWFQFFKRLCRLCIDRFVGVGHPSSFYWKNVKLAITHIFSLVKLAHTQHWLVVVLECWPIRAQNQIMGYHVHANSVYGFLVVYLVTNSESGLLIKPNGLFQPIKWKKATTLKPNGFFMMGKRSSFKPNSLFSMTRGQSCNEV